MALPDGYSCQKENDIIEVKSILSDLRIYVDKKFDAMQLVLTGTQIDNASITEQLKGLLSIVQEIKDSQKTTNSALDELKKKPAQRMDLIIAVFITAIVSGLVAIAVSKLFGGV